MVNLRGKRRMTSSERNSFKRIRLSQNNSDEEDDDSGWTKLPTGQIDLGLSSAGVRENLVAVSSSPQCSSSQPLLVRDLAMSENGGGGGNVAVSVGISSDNSSVNASISNSAFAFPSSDGSAVLTQLQPAASTSGGLDALINSSSQTTGDRELFCSLPVLPPVGTFLGMPLRPVVSGGPSTSFSDAAGVSTSSIEDYYYGNGGNLEEYGFGASSEASALVRPANIETPLSSAIYAEKIREEVGELKRYFCSKRLVLSACELPEDFFHCRTKTVIWLWDDIDKNCYIIMRNGMQTSLDSKVYILYNEAKPHVLERARKLIEASPNYHTDTTTIKWREVKSVAARDSDFFAVCFKIVFSFSKGDDRDSLLQVVSRTDANTLAAFYRRWHEEFLKM